MMTFSTRHAWVLAVCLAIASCRTTPVGTASTTHTYEPIDLTFPVAMPVVAEFRGPNGTVLRLNSFPGVDGTRIRFSAPSSGSWRYVARAGTRVVQTGDIEVSQGDRHGLVRARGHSLAFDDGTPFVALGENRINIYDPKWNWRELSIDEYLQHMADHDQTVLRVFIVSDIENEETGGSNLGVIEPTLGHFDERVAAQFDEIMRAALKRDIQVVLVAFALGFSEDDAWKSWDDNPYSKMRGGPAESRFDFFESQAARDLAANRIRYLAARYAAFRNLLAIDLLNEPEWDGGIPEVSWSPWAQAMTKAWDDADPYEHLVTVGSVGLHWNIEGDEREWWSSDACDIVQWHLYGKEVYDVHALAAEMTRKVKETWSFDKPIMVGEFAYGGESKPEYDHTHVGLWSAAFSGAGVLAHSAPPFNEDSDELMTPERARHYRVLRETLRRLGHHHPIVSTAINASSWALSGENTFAIWLMAQKDRYSDSTIDARVTLSLTEGRWRVRWLDDVTGKQVATESVQSRGETVTLRAPAFSRHVVALLERE